MRLFLIIDETCFYQPDFVADFLRQTPDEVVGALLVTKVLPKNNLEHYMKKHFYFLRPQEALKLAWAKRTRGRLDRTRTPGRDGAFYSVRSVFTEFGIAFREAHYKINQPEYLDYVRASEPDLILSSNSLIFGKSLLNLPTHGCLNRHSALLPSYGGLWPVFQAVRSGEKEVGVSAHTMEAKIDRGILLAQQAVTVEDEDTVNDLYIKCFAISAQVCLDAIDKIRDGDLSPVETERELSYFTFPEKAHWQELRKRGRKFI